MLAFLLWCSLDGWGPPPVLLSLQMRPVQLQERSDPRLNCSKCKMKQIFACWLATILYELQTLKNATSRVVLNVITTCCYVLCFIYLIHITETFYKVYFV